MNETITLTFGDCAENHNGMQKIGKMANNGLTLEELNNAKEYYEAKGNECLLIKLNNIKALNDVDSDKFPLAFILVIRKAIENSDDVYNEQSKLERDKKMLNYGRVVNKWARHNLCFSDFDQIADFANGKGTVINFKKLPLLSQIRNQLPVIIKNNKVINLQCEANYYYDIAKTYIGFHGDTERKIVIGVRLGATFPLHYQWYKNNEKVSELFTINLNHGDMYIM